MLQPPLRRYARLPLLAALVAAPVSTFAVTAGAHGATTTTESLYSSSSSVGNVDTDTGSVDLGVRFSPKVGGSVTAIEFYRGSTTNTAKIVDLWDASTQSRIGRGTSSTTISMGWTRVALSSAVNVIAGHTYVASVLAPAGRYNAISRGFATSRSVADLSVPANGGVYTYSGSEAYPTSTWNSSEYLVSPVFTPSGTSTATPTPTSSSTPTPTPTSSSTPTPTPTSACTNPKWSSSAPRGQWSDNGFLVNNDMWSGEAGPQTINACGYNSWYVISNQPELANNPGSVKTYPDTDKPFYQSGSEPLVSSLSQLTSSFNETSPGVGQYDWAYDLWLNNWANEVMVWNDYHGLPVPPVGSNAVTVTLDGTTYHAWRYGTGYIALARATTTTAGNVDLRHVLNWLITQGWLPSASTLTDAEYGVEISQTAGAPAKFSLNNYSLTAN